MLAPVPAILPDSTLAPADIIAKFSPQTLAGIGCGFRGLRGFGCGCSDLDEEGNCLDPEPCTTTETLPLPPVPITSIAPSSTTSGTPTTVVSTSPSNINLGPLLQTLAQGGSNAALLAVASPGESISPTGALTYQNPGYSIQGTTATSTSSSMGLILLLAVAGIAVIALGGKR